MTGPPSSLPDRLRTRADTLVARLDGTPDARLMREAADHIDLLDDYAVQMQARYSRLRNLLRDSR